MINWLHTNIPEAIMVSIGPVSIHWYSVCIVSGILAAIFITLRLANYFNIKKDDLMDLYFWMIISGVIGARFYHIFIEYQYYLDHPLQSLMIWKGGLAIHGVIIGCLLTLYIYAKKKKINQYKLLALFAPAAPLAQAIGRWGNYFNQENFGIPTDLSWGIPIQIIYRIPKFITEKYYHPAFLYESIGSLIVFAILISLTIWLVKTKRLSNGYCLILITTYLILYSILRIIMETFRIDETIMIYGVRWPAIMSLIIILLSLFSLIRYRSCQKQKSMLS